MFLCRKGVKSFKTAPLAGPVEKGGESKIFREKYWLGLANLWELRRLLKIAAGDWRKQV